MDILSATAQNLISPPILFFVLGVLAGTLRSSLTIPETVSKSVALYLMMAIGYRGGAELSHNGLNGSILSACAAAMALGAMLPVAAYALLRWTTRIDAVTAAATAAHYGSVSAVTFAAAIAALNQQGVRFEPYVVVLMAVMEAPAILTGLLLARRGTPVTDGGSPVVSLAKTAFHEVLLHGSVFLLLGSFAVGWVSGSRGSAELNEVLVKPFHGILCIFLLDLGLAVARRLSDLRALNLRLAAFGLYMPLIGASAALGLAFVLRLSAGGAALLAVLGASASYIVVPAVMRDALPTASPAIYMTLVLGITFPFNLIVGIPLYQSAARILKPALSSTGPGGAEIHELSAIERGGVPWTAPGTNDRGASPGQAARGGALAGLSLERGARDGAVNGKFRRYWRVPDGFRTGPEPRTDRRTQKGKERN